MRKIQFLLAIWMFAIVTCGAMPAYAQAQVQTQVPTKAQTKAAEKAGKARAKALKKEESIKMWYACCAPGSQIF